MRPKMMMYGGLLLAVLILVTGCESHDEQLAEFAQRAADQQTQQNEAMARQSELVAQQGQEIASAARELVEQDATARREMIEAHAKLQSKLQGERHSIDVQRQELHAERQAAAAAAIREPVIAQAILVSGLILAALLPLLVTAYALRRLPHPGPSDQLLAETLIETFEAEHRRLEGGNPALPDDRAAPRLGGPGAGSEARAAGPAPENPAV
jgi:hypothetical protein